ncbi:MAG: glutamate--tRNA ligase [Thiothrix sp.]|nr:MAG: glutamate--tRNA ligase [Thiothrix sp.]
MTIRTRFAPSPTGYLHIGGARTALFSWLFARKHGGQFILRVEDTDRERSTEASVQAILDGMEWLQLDYDEGPFFQTERMERYRAVIQQLLDRGQAYHCYSSKEELEAMRAEQMARKQKPRYDGRYRDFKGTPPAGIDPVIRFRNPVEGHVVIDDMVKGAVVVENSELDDLIIARSDGTPTYNLTVVVDDLDMNITHVIRGDDHLNNTPRQINILRALGADLPKYAHLPMILGDDGKRLSKRHGAVSVMQYAKDGYLPEALLNYLVRLGWSHGDQELFSREEMVDLFQLDSVNSAASTFNPGKLLWLNEQYLKTLDPSRITSELENRLQTDSIDISDGPALEAVARVLRERSKTLLSMAASARYFYQDPQSYDEEASKKHFQTGSDEVLASLAEALGVVEEWQAKLLHGCVAEQAKLLELKMGKVGMPLRVALTGGTDSPDIGLTLQLIGKEAVLRRINKAVEVIRQQKSG